MAIKRMFRKLGRHKKDGSKSRESSSRENTPSPQVSIRSTSPRPAQSRVVSALALRSSAQINANSLPKYRQAGNSSTSHDGWANLTAFLGLLSHAPALSPLTAAIGSLNLFFRTHDDILTGQRDYEALRTQLEGLFRDLCAYFPRDTPPVMTASILNLSEAIRTEITRVYDEQNRGTISRYMQVCQDLDKITECYRRIQVHLDRIMLNASLNVWKALDKHAAEAQLDKLNMSAPARYDSVDAHVAQRRECTPNTREQVLFDLTAWKDDQEGEKICWLNGMAGTGKTTIVNTLCSALDKQYELGASFFCSRSLPDCRNVKFIIPTIAYQLARFSSPFRGALLQALDRDPDVHTKVLHVQFRRMIVDPLQVAAPSLPTGVLVVIDALDECDDGNGVEQILKVLLESGSSLPVKFLVSSRPEYHIRDWIGKSTRKAQLVLHELDEKIVKADIKTYLQVELESKLAIVTDGQLAALAERAGALFIYAATVVRYIKRGDTAERLATVLRVPSPGQGSTNQTREIDQVYTAVLTSAFDNKDLEESDRARMRQVMHTVVCAQEPLAVNALAGLLGFTPSQVASALDPLWSVLHLSESDSSHRVTTLHASFPDYMLDSDRANQFACNAETHNGKLAALCFIRIGRNIPQFNICRLGSSYTFDADVPDLEERVKKNISLELLYACQYWAVHLSAGGEPDERGGELHEFLSKRLLLWLEVLNLTKRIDKAIRQMEIVISWLQTAQGPESTVSLARDARRFVTMFATSPVSRSTPHLYISMLATWPDSRLISDHYIPQTMDLVKVKGIETTERQLSVLTIIPTGSLIHCVAYSPDGTFFAAGTDNGTILIWDAVSCRMTVEPIKAHISAVRAIAISPGGTQICSGSHGAWLRIWDPQTGGQIVGPLEGHTNWIYSVDYSPDGQWIASASHDGTVCIWDTHNWQTKGGSLKSHDGRVLSVVFSPDGTIVAAGSESLIHLWDPRNGQMIGAPFKGHTSYVWTLSFTPDGKYLASGSRDCTIYIWDVSASQIAFGPLQGHQSEIMSVAFSPSGNRFASASVDNTIRIWDTTTWTTHSLFRHTGNARAVKFSLDGSRLISGSPDGSMRVWEVTDITDDRPEESRSEGHGEWIRSVVFSPCGAYLVSGSDDMTICTWGAQNGQLIHDPLEGHNDWVTRVGMSADSSHIYSVSIDRIIHVWNCTNGQLEYTIGPVETDGHYDAQYQEFWPAILLFNNRRVICGSKSGHIYTLDNNKLTNRLTCHSKAVYSFASSINEQSFVSGDHAGDVIVWDASNGERLLGPIKAHSASIYCVAFSSDGSHFASGSNDCTIRLWHSSTGLPVGEPLRGHTSVIRSVSFCPQGKQLVSGSQDRTIRLWDIISGQSTAVLEGHTGWLFSVAFSPDGARIASGSADMAIRIWDTSIFVEDSTDNECYDVDNAGTSADHKEANNTSSWTMDEHGWVYDHTHRPLFWVPSDLRSVLIRPQNTVLISRQGRIELDFAGAMIGDKWETCYKPFAPADDK